MGKNSRARREKMQQVLKAREKEGLVKRARFYDALRKNDVLSQAQVFVIDDILEYQETLAANTEDESDIYLIKEFFTNCDPPFRYTFFEWGDLEWRMAVLMESFDSQTDGHNLLMLPVWGFGSPLKITVLPRMMAKMSRNSHLIDLVRIEEPDLIDNRSENQIFKQMETDLLSTETIPINQNWLKRYGLLFAFLRAMIELKRVNRDTFEVLEYAELLYLASFKMCLPPLVALQFLNARNITTVEHEPTSIDNLTYQRHFGVPMTKYHTLALNSETEHSDSERNPQQKFDVMPLHLVRGHFKTYTEDAPRFGRNTPENVGTFWVPSFAKGNAKNGIVVKDYKVSAD